MFTFLKKNSKGVFLFISSTAAIKVAYDNEFFKIQKAQAFSLFSSSSGIDLSDTVAKTITDEAVIKKNNDKMKYRMEAFITNLQGKIVKELQTMEKDATFIVDRWTRKEGGGGITCIVQDGKTFERGAVNVSVVSGILPPQAVAQMRYRGKTTIPTDKNVNFSACGISSVIHPRNPHVPTLHFNYRYFEVEVAPGKFEWWFGGGTDMTPYYLDEDDVKHFHRTLKTACDEHDPKYYSDFKKWCDNYFTITHRNETRGVGGIFFDDLDKPNQDKVFNFIKTCGNSILPGYVPIVKKNMNKAYGEAERSWQLLRRGKYVEFNLVYDRGTKFGLMTPGARIESILVSLPRVATWDYKYEPKPGSPEAELDAVLKNPKDWI